MSFLVEAYFAAHGRSGWRAADLRSRDDVDYVLWQIASYPQPRTARFAAIVGTRYSGMTPTEYLLVDAHGARQVGALAYVGRVQGQADPGRWTSLSATPMDDPPMLQVNRSRGTPFPAGSELPLELVRTALHEYRETAARPTCTAWTAWRASTEVG